MCLFKVEFLKLNINIIMELKHIVIVNIYCHMVNERQFLYISEDFVVIYATYGDGRCKASCEDSVDLKMFNIYDTNNIPRYNEVYILKIGTAVQSI